jgi:hypothetical protein
MARIGYCSLVLFLLVGTVFGPAPVCAQGVTSGAISGIVTDAQKQPVAGAGVSARHEPSGTIYEAVTATDGRFFLPGMRVGGPYTVTVFYSGTGAAAFEPQVLTDVTVNLGVATNLQVTVRALKGGGPAGAY